MNSKAIRKQLLAAVAMVLVAAVALGSSTYAWFVAAGSVTATDMKVNVQSSGGLVISYAGAGDAWGVSASGKIENPVPLTPASTADMTDWSTAQAKVANNYAFDKETIQNVKEVVLPNGTYTDNGYAIMRAFKIRSAAPGQLCKGLYVEKIEVTGAANTLDTSLRVGFRYKYATGSNDYGDVKSFITGPVSITGSVGQNEKNQPTGSYKFYSTKTTADTAATTVTLTDIGKTARIVPTNVDVTNGTDKPVYVEIYLWFEGQDENLFSDNVKAIDNLSITVTFTSDSMDTQQSAASEIDLSGSSITLAESATSVGGKNYYKITGATATGDKVIYSDTKPLSSTSKIYTADNDDTPTTMTQVEQTVKLPS